MQYTYTNQGENFTHNIAWLRKKHKFSKRKMANLLDIGVGSLNQLENGIIPPKMKINVIFAIEQHFGIDPIDLFGRKLNE